jgi:hypothetical protein
MSGRRRFSSFIIARHDEEGLCEVCSAELGVGATAWDFWRADAWDWRWLCSIECGAKATIDRPPIDIQSAHDSPRFNVD